MSNTFKKTTLGAALAVALCAAPAAFAYNLSTGAPAPGDTPVLVATADIIDGTTDIGVNEAVTITLDSTDLILGRTTGFTVRMTLDNGATFGSVLASGNLAAGAGAPGWVPTVAAGGGLTDNFVVINMAPPAVPTALTTGTMVAIAAADFVIAPTPASGLILDTLTALQTAGQQVVGTFKFVDPVTTADILPVKTLPILKSDTPTVLACDTSGLAPADYTKTIDVGSDNQDAKTLFVASGEINDPITTNLVNLGEVVVAKKAGFASFDYAVTDEFTTVVSGDFSAFSQAGVAGDAVYLSDDATCAAAPIPALTGAVNNAAGTVTFEYTGADAPTFTVAGFNLFLCASVPAANEVPIDASKVSVVTTFTRGDSTATGASCPLLPLRYNGSVVDVYHVNPAGNTAAQSFVRIINPSDITGLVTIDGIDDSGAAGASPITFTLAAGESKQINSEVLENGGTGFTGAWGNGVGKWRATVTGEFADMKVQGLNRNTTDNTVTNLTDADGEGEQALIHD